MSCNDVSRYLLKKSVTKQKTSNRGSMFFVGAPGGDRTLDLGLKRPLLYH